MSDHDLEFLEELNPNSLHIQIDPPPTALPQPALTKLPSLHLPNTGGNVSNGTARLPSLGPMPELAALIDQPSPPLSPLSSLKDPYDTIPSLPKSQSVVYPTHPQGVMSNNTPNPNDTSGENGPSHRAGSSSSASTASSSSSHRTSLSFATPSITEFNQHISSKPPSSPAFTSSTDSDASTQISQIPQIPPIPSLPSLSLIGSSVYVNKYSVENEESLHDQDHESYTVDDAHIQHIDQQKLSKAKVKPIPWCRTPMTRYMPHKSLSGLSGLSVYV